MASINPSLISDQSEQKWVVEISEILKHQLESELEIQSLSIFQVPKSLTTQKPEAFDPQLIGLGPIHHFRPTAYKNMEQKKLDAVQRVLKRQNIKDFKLTVLDNVQKLVPAVRPCYDMFLQDDNVSLAWIFAIDGLFLLDLLHTYKSDRVSRKKKSHQDTNSVITIVEQVVSQDDLVWSLKKAKKVNVLDNPSSSIEHEAETLVTSEIQVEEVSNDSSTITKCRPEIDPNRRLLAQDIMMLQNQIPFMVLKGIGKALHTSLGNSSNSSDHNNFSPSIFRAFCEIHSPLKLCLPSQAPVDRVEHLLHYMYHSILNNVPLHNQNTRILENIPKGEIAQLYNQITSALETFTQKESGIPSASTFHDRAGFTFHRLPKHQGITKIAINNNKKEFHLPRVTLNIESDTTLSNLVAYEMLTANSNKYPLFDFVFLMCKLIVNVNDVKLLKKAKIIKSDQLSDADVVKLFVEMSGFISSMKMKEKSKFIQGDIEKAKEVYESRPIMMAYLAVKKLAEWLLVVLRAIGGFVESSWKIVVFMVSVVAVFMLMWQAYCADFGCDKTTNVTTLASHGWLTG